jgi:hypothetical protein
MVPNDSKPLQTWIEVNSQRRYDRAGARDLPMRGLRKEIKP